MTKEEFIRARACQLIEQISAQSPESKKKLYEIQQAIVRRQREANQKKKA